MFKDYFDIYVGLVSGKEDIYKNEEFGNIEILNGENKIEKYNYIEKITHAKMKKSINIYYKIKNNLIKDKYENSMKIIGLNGEHQEILTLYMQI